MRDFASEHGNEEVRLRNFQGWNRLRWKPYSRAYLELSEELKCIATFLSSRARGSGKGQSGLLVLF